MRTSVTPAGVGEGNQTRLARNGAKWRNSVASSTRPRPSSGPEPNLDFAGSGSSPTLARNSNPFGAASLLLVLMLQPTSPPPAGGTALFCQTVSAVVPGRCTQNWLLSDRTLPSLPSPRISIRQVSWVSTG